MLNPSGIVFGPNAQLNIGGSFLGTTASSIKFGDGVEFSATNSAPLLTMTAPIGLQMGQTSANIEVQDSGYTQIYDRGNLLPFDRRSYNGGLAVAGSKSLTLLGGNIQLNSGLLIAEDGQINLGAVGVNNFVSLGATPLGWQLGYDGITQFGDIQLNERSQFDAKIRRTKLTTAICTASISIDLAGLVGWSISRFAILSIFDMPASKHHAFNERSP